MRPDIVPGSVFPDYELPDHTNTTRRLSEMQGDDPLILTLARGHYCPKEHQQHLQLAGFYPQIAVAYTQVATISTDDHHTSQEFRASVGAQWPFLADPDRTVQRDLDIAEFTDPEHDPMIPHTLVLKPGLVVHSIYSGYWYWVDRRSRTSAVTSAPQRRRSVRIGISAHPGCARHGTRATSPRSTDGTDAPPSPPGTSWHRLQEVRHDAVESRIRRSRRDRSSAVARPNPQTIPNEARPCDARW
jgi:peroxiredoxin